jgi:precorrin-3B C17-methyltransferase
LKPWEIIERRLIAAAEGDFVIALYNPASKARSARIHEAFGVLRSRKAAATPVAFARAIGREDERLTITTLSEAKLDLVDMSTLVIIGSSQTRLIPRDQKSPWLLTPRSYGDGR